MNLVTRPSNIYKRLFNIVQSGEKEGEGTQCILGDERPRLNGLSMLWNGMS